MFSFVLFGSWISLILNVLLIAAWEDGDTCHSAANNKQVVLTSFLFLCSTNHSSHIWFAQNFSSFKLQHICEKEESQSKPRMCLKTFPSELGH